MLELQRAEPQIVVHPPSAKVKGLLIFKIIEASNLVAKDLGGMLFVNIKTCNIR